MCSKKTKEKEETIKKKENNTLLEKPLLKRDYKNIQYFCPFCRFIFNDIQNDHKIQDVKKCRGYKYQCPKCRKCFNKDTYEEESRNGKNYNVDETAYHKPTKYIEEHITELWYENYSNRKIHDITHFSRTKIGNITKILNNQEAKKYNFREFMILIRAIDERKRTVSFSSIYMVDIRTHNIRKAFRFGCSVRQVAKIFNISNSTAIKGKFGEYISIKKMKDALRGEKDSQELREFCEKNGKKNKSKSESSKKDENEKRIQDILSEYKEVEAFSRICEPPIREEDFFKRRHFIRICKDKNMVTVRKIKDRKLLKSFELSHY